MNSQHPIECFALNNGNYIPTLGFGTFNIPKDQTSQAVQRALKNGYRHIDTAHIYKNEEEVGEGISSFLQQNSNVLRSQIFVTTKIWNGSKAKEDVRPACEESLRKLNLKYVDLYLIHQRVCFKRGLSAAKSKEDFVDIPIEETWREMEKLVKDGLVKSIGVSNFNIKQLKKF